MASALSTQVMYLANVRATGTKDANGIAHGGIYYPASMKNGKPVSARWEGNVALNGRDWTDENGELHEGRRVYLRLIVWNSKNSAPGKGMADIFAKHVSVGKALSCSVQAESFEKRIFSNGQPVLDNTGNPITYQAVVFRVTGDLVFGDDSSKTVAAEVARYNGSITFDSRPAQWNIPGTPDNEAWKQIVSARSATVFQGGDTYGYARVIIPQNTTVMNPNMQAPAQTLNNGLQAPQNTTVMNPNMPTSAQGQQNTVTQATSTSNNTLQMPQQGSATQATPDSMRMFL